MADSKNDVAFLGLNATKKIASVSIAHLDGIFRVLPPFRFVCFHPIFPIPIHATKLPHSG